MKQIIKIYKPFVNTKPYLIQIFFWNGIIICFKLWKKDYKKKCLLIIDKPPSHYNHKVLEEFKKNDTYFVYISEGLTRYLQHLNIGINAPFKNTLKNAYTYLNVQNYKEQKLKKILSIIRENIVNMVSKIWWNEIKIESIKNSFKKVGISLKQDGQKMMNGNSQR